MGCGSSRSNDSQLITLCRERTSLIRRAADRRYAMAAAHSNYLRSLSPLADAIHSFVLQELAAAAAASPPSIVLPPPRKSSSPSSGSVTSLSHSLSPDLGGSDSHLRISSESESVKSGRDSESSPRIRVSRSPNYDFMRPSSSAIPTMIYQNPYAWDDWNSYPANAPLDDGFRARSRNPTAEVAPPPPPPAAGGSAWDFFNPFDSYEQYVPNDSPDKYYNVGSGSSTTNSSEVREREGIPDLEDEAEEEILKVVKKGKKVMEDDSKSSRDFGEGTSKSMQQEDEIVSDEKEGKSISGSSKERRSIEEERRGKWDKKVISEEDIAVAPSNVNVVPARASRDLVEVVKEIKELFKSVTNCGEEISRMLEVGKVNYRSRSRMYRVVSSRILEPMGLSMLRPLRPFKRSRFSSTSTAYGNHFGMKSGNLSSTLEKLYVWERRLYKEVKGEEKLRILYEKKCRRLRYLDNHGAESHKIDSTRASIRRLRTKLSIVIRSVDAISSRMHRLRDKELQPQLNELINGLIRMWKSMLECHQKQFRAIIDSKSDNIMAKPESVANVTRELEVQLINWYSGFHDWINSQRSFIEALNGWLIKWLPVKVEETPDGIVPFSPSRIEAPAVFIISNDWDNALARVSEAKVVEAIHNFALSAHRLWESRDEEQRHKVKAESLSKAYNRRLSSLQNYERLHEDLDVANGHTQVYHGDQRLELIKRRLDEERAKRDQSMKQIQDIASKSVNTGLHPIFEALENFSLETVKAYEAIRILEGG